MGGQVSGVSFLKKSEIIFHLEHILEEVILLLLALPEPAQHQLTEIREINQTFPGLVIIIEQYKCYEGTSDLAISLGISTISCSVGFRPSIFSALCRS